MLALELAVSPQCFWMRFYGGDDNFSAEANFSHALLSSTVKSALQSSQLTDVSIAWCECWEA